MHLKISYNSTRLRNRDFTATASNKEKIIQTFAVYAKARQDSGLLLLGRPTPPLYIDSKPADASLVKVGACPLSLVYARAC